MVNLKNNSKKLCTERVYYSVEFVSLLFSNIF